MKSSWTLSESRGARDVASVARSADQAPHSRGQVSQLQPCTEGRSLCVCGPFTGSKVDGLSFPALQENHASTIREHVDPHRQDRRPSPLV